MPTESEIKALHLIQSNTRDLMPAGHDLINRSVVNLLKMGLIEYASRRNIAYKLTVKGKSYIVVV